MGLYYKLQLSEILIGGSSDVLYTTRSVFINIIIPGSVLLNNHNKINYHSVIEAAL